MPESSPASGSGTPELHTDTAPTMTTPSMGSGVSRRGLLLAGLAGAGGLALAACSADAQPLSGVADVSTGPAAPATGGASSAPSAGARPTAAVMSTRATVPVLCYHQVRPWTGGDAAYARSMLVIPPTQLAAQLDAIKAAGYTTISPQQYRDHLFADAALPTKPVILSLDDGKDDQVSAALPALTQRGMTGTFFVMTVILGNSGWMKRDDVKRLADAGMTIGSHTWDHHMVTKYSGKDYATQLDQPREVLRKLSGQPVDDFAYPYGAWNTAILPHIASAGYQAAYQLMDKPMDKGHPELTLRRILAVSTWSGPQVVAKLDSLT